MRNDFFSRKWICVKNVASVSRFSLLATGGNKGEAANRLSCSAVCYEDSKKR